MNDASVWELTHATTFAICVPVTRIFRFVACPFAVVIVRLAVARPVVTAIAILFHVF